MSKLCCVLIVALILGVYTTPARAQTTGPAVEKRTFELTPFAPPVPALKYQLLFSFADRRPGNAAPIYLQAILLMGPEIETKADQALAAYEAGDQKTFNTLADAVVKPEVIRELEVAGRRETCDWQSPIRELGIQCLLPHLGPLRNGAAKLLKIKALEEIMQKKPQSALAALRLGYELSDKVGQEPALVSSMVSASITQMMNEALAQLMTQPDSLNLYWALSTFPNHRSILQRGWDAEALCLLLNIPKLAEVRQGHELSADQWRKILVDDVALFFPISEIHGKMDGEFYPHPIRDADPNLLRQARERYAQSHHLSAEQAARIDLAIVLGNFYFQEYERASDEVAKLRGLAYPVLLAKTSDLSLQLAQLKKEQPTNPFLVLLSGLHRSVWRFASLDRELAALTAVEALRSYAAAHAGQLPQRIEEVTDTPIPDNPATGRPFEYRLENGRATLSDLRSEVSLEYEVTIRLKS